MADDTVYMVIKAAAYLQDALVLLLIARGFVIHRRRRASHPIRFVSLHPSCLWVGMVGYTLFALINTLVDTEKLTVFAWCAFEVLQLMGVVLLLAYCNETIAYDDTGFVATDLLGRKRSFSYDEVTGYLPNGRDTLLYCGRRRVRIDFLAIGGEGFMACAEHAYFLRNKKNIPRCGRRVDPFKGNVVQPWAHFFVVLLMLAFGIASLIIGFTLTAPREDIPADAIRFRTSFINSRITEEHHGTLLLSAPGYDKPFALEWLSGFEVPVPDPDALCSGDSYDVWVRENKEQYDIYALSAVDGSPILTTRDTHTAYVNENSGLRAIMGILGGLCMIYAIFGFLVGRYPERFAPGFRKHFFRNDVWTPESMPRKRQKQIVHQQKTQRRGRK